MVLDGPDLTGFAAQHCVWADASARSASGSLYSEACGVPVNGKTALTLTPAPALTEPKEGEPLTPSTRLAWSKFPGGIHVLRFRPPWNGPERPEITLFTAGIAAAWPDLRPVGIAFPRFETSYGCMVMGRGPFADLDAATGAAGMASLLPVQQQSAYTSCPSLFIKGAPNPDGGAPPEAKASRQGAPAPFAVARRVPAVAADQKPPPPTGVVIGILGSHLR